MKATKFTPVIESSLRGRMVKVPDAIYECGGINVLGKRIKSLLFTTDVAIITNNNANSIIAVYPFTPQLSITNAILNVASVPVFVGVGGGTTTGPRSVSLALQSELLGAYGVVVNAPMQNENIQMIDEAIDIPIIASVGSYHDDFLGKAKAGARIFNVTGGSHTADLVSHVRTIMGPEFPIIATGGDNDDQIRRTIEAGANAITYTPPSTSEIFKEVMVKYRQMND